MQVNIDCEKQKKYESYLEWMEYTIRKVIFELYCLNFTENFIDFDQCRKTGTNLNQYMKIYNKRKCGQCEGKVTITRIGDDSERVTYYCPNCQTNTLKSQVK